MSGSWWKSDLMEGELYSALKEEEASESVSSTNFSEKENVFLWFSVYGNDAVGHLLNFTGDAQGDTWEQLPLIPPSFPNIGALITCSKIPVQ
ncbi:hypothetical protein P7K49_029324 [Saguinus oedipus]|uniref:Uncharacterized protein n=1 Tax=Saguinus oedipus TaxID=9490 RepID=A0ABQ9U6W0_SAGOE|nr:hypothetical protein P7K49_029324 [Saguinus oedipus]